MNRHDYMPNQKTTQLKRAVFLLGFITRCDLVSSIKVEQMTCACVFKPLFRTSLYLLMTHRTHQLSVIDF